MLVYEAAPVSGAGLEETALQMRRFFGVADRPFFPILEILEHVLPIAFGDDYSFEIGDVDDLGPEHGRTYPDERRVILREDVYVNLTEHRGRDRFTAVHELAHLVLHDRRRLSRRLSSSGPLKTYRDPEWQANRLAGSLLMPRDYFQNCKRITEVMELFGVTKDAALVRARQLKVGLAHT